MVGLRERRLGGHPAREEAAGERNPHDHPDVAGQRFAEEELGRPLAEHVEDDLNRLDAGVLDGFERLLDLLDTDPVVEDLASGHHVVECLEQGRPVVHVGRRAVQLDQVQCLHFQVLQTAVDEPFDVLRRVPGGDVRIEAASGLCCNDHPGVRPGTPDGGQTALTAPVAVHVGGVEEVDPFVQGSTERCLGVIVSHLAPVAADRPGSKTDLGDLEPGSAQRTLRQATGSHGQMTDCTLSRSSAPITTRSPVAMYMMKTLAPASAIFRANLPSSPGPTSISAITTSRRSSGMNLAARNAS